MSKQAVSVRIEPETLEAVRVLAKEGRRPISQQFGIIVEDYLARQAGDRGTSVASVASTQTPVTR